MPVVGIDFDMLGFDRVGEVETKPSPAFVVFAELNKSKPMVQLMFELALICGSGVPLSASHSIMVSMVGSKSIVDGTKAEEKARSEQVKHHSKDKVPPLQS